MKMYIFHKNNLMLSENLPLCKLNLFHPQEQWFSNFSVYLDYLKSL